MKHWKGRRIRKQVWNNTGGTGTAASDQIFLYDGWNLLAVLNYSGTSLVRSFLWGLDLSGTLQGAGGVGGLLAVSDQSAINNQPSTHFVAFDGSGNVAALVNAADGTVSARYEYAPFGEVLRATGPMGKSNPFRFSTKYQDDESDILMYPHRPYSAATARFLTRDPLGVASFLRAQIRRDRKQAPALFKESLKPAYAFVSNDAIDYIDPLGLNVYKVQHPSGVSASVDHRQVVGDDGKGGCYILDFYPKKKCWVCLFGATLAGPGEVSVQMIKNQSASDYISANRLNVVATVETDNIYFYPSGDSVDLLLGQDAAKEDQLGAPNYILLYNDCGTIANSWLKHAREVVKQAEDSAPGEGDLGFPW